MASQRGTNWVHEEDATPKSREDAEHFLRVGIPIQDTPAVNYLFGPRKIDGPYPADLLYIEDARPGEGALCCPLYFDGRVVAVQLIYLTRDGEKSLVEPTKQRFSLEHAPGAVFRMPYSGTSTDVVVFEGYEDTASGYRYGALRCQVLGLPGIGALRHQKLPAGTRVIVVPDGDPEGSAGAKLLQEGIDALLEQKLEVLVVPTPENWDTNRVLCEHGVKGLQLFLKSAEEAAPSEVLRLAKLSLLDYGRERKAAAKAMGITVAILDQLVERERKKRAARANAGDDWIDIDEVRPWSTEVDGVELLDDLTAAIHSFVVMTKHQARAIALWVLFTWVFAAASCALKLWVKSTEKRSGKTRLIEILSYLVRNPLLASRMSVAAFYRLIEMKDKPTILLDEFDSWAADNQDLRGILNAGFDKRFASVWICAGDDHKPTEFDVFCPQVVAGIGDVKDTVADRSLKIELTRKLRSESVFKLRRRGTGVLDKLAQQCARWAADNIADLVNADPTVPESINDRAADGWEPLLAIADQAGGAWPQRARQAAIKLSGGGYDLDSESVGAQLAHDVLAVIGEHESVGERIPSKSLTTWLVGIEDGAWVEFKNERSLTQFQLSRLLRKFKIKSHHGERANWYSRQELVAGLSRYDQEQPKPNGHDPSAAENFSPPPISGFQPFSPSAAAENKGFRDNSDSSAAPSPEGSTNARNPSKTATAEGLKGRNPGNGGEEQNSGSNGSSEAVSNGAAEERRRRVSLADEVKRLQAANPKWSAKRIAHELGRSEKRIARYLT